MDFNVLSQSELVATLFARLEQEQSVGLVGLPGSGKSVSCTALVQRWGKGGNVAISLLGDEFQRARRYFPFQDAISQSNITKDLLLKNASSAVAKGATAIPFAGPLAGFVLEKLFAHSTDSAKARYQYLSPDEQNVLYHLQRIAGKNPLLLICDDLQFWDEGSMSLLRIMVEGRLNDAYPFLADARYVFVQTIRSADDPAPIDFNTLSEAPISLSRLTYVSRDEVPAVLSLLGLKHKVPHEVILAIHGVCGGHLHVLQQLVTYLQANDCAMADDWAGRAEADFLSGLVVSRLKELGTAGDEILELLKTASVIGTIFSDQELACLCDRDPRQVRKLLTTGENLNLVRRGRQSSHFAHGIVHQSLQCVRSANKEELHGQFASCLQRLRPGDYRSRVRHLLAAGEIEHAAEVAACALLQDTRNGVVSLDETTLRALVTDNGLMDVLDCLCRAQERIQAYDFHGAISLLSCIDPVAPSRLQAEAAYIRAIAWIKEYRYGARDKAIKDLQAWIPKIADEGELAVRMLSTQLVALVHQRREDDARHVEREIVESLSLRAAFDPDALDALRVLDRKADLLYPAEQSYPRLARSKSHFMPQDGGQPRNFYQYCASSLNLAANRIVCGEYDSALTNLRELTSFLNASPDHRFTRFEVLTNNLIVAELLAGLYDAATATTCFERLANGKRDTMDFCLIQSNYGACAAMAGDSARARSILQPLVERLKADTEADDLHVYLAGTNLASTLYLGGECASALKLSCELANIVDTAMPPHRSYFRKRHDILQEAMESGKQFSVADWHDLPRQATLSGPGPSWKHYGCGFLFTDLQIFTES